MDKRVALVTGSTSGIGLGVADHLAAKGCNIILTGLGDQDVIDNIVAEFKRKYENIKIDYVPCDLLKPEEIIEFCKTVKNLYPDGVDILVNNAGIQYTALIEDYPKDKWDMMIGVTLTAPYMLIKEFVPDMKRKGWGRIINMSSQMGIISAVEKAPYSAAKAGLIGLTKGVALETAAHGVTCNAICPGFTDAPMFQNQINTYAKKHNMSYDQARTEIFTTAQPNKKPVTIDEISELAVFLCSSGADSITGSSLVIDGGFTAR